MSIYVNDHVLTNVRLRRPPIGPWWAECDCADEADNATGSVELRIGDVLLIGTVDDGASGIFQGTRRLRIVGGAGGWQSVLPKRAYHSDAGVSRARVANDAASECGETIGTFEPASRLQVDYVREETSAGSTLEHLANGIPWYVDYAGVTHVATINGAAVATKVLSYHPRERYAVLDVDRIDEVDIGSIITDRLEEPITVNDIEISVTPTKLIFRAWHSGGTATASPLVQALSSAVEHIGARKLWGHYTYRVISMSVDRVNLQAVDRDLGLPDLPSVSMWPGAPGVHAELTKGSEVLVCFRDGNRSRPVITQFRGKGGSGFVPVAVDLSGNGTGRPVARQGDLVISGGVGTVCTLVPLTGIGAPPNNAVVAGVPCFISFDETSMTTIAQIGLAKPLVGAVSSGSALVRSG